MKSNYCTYSTTGLAKEISKATEKTLNEYKDQLYDAVQWDCFQQALACCFAALESMGWRKKRLTEFKNKVDDITHLMESTARKGTRGNTAAEAGAKHAARVSRRPC